MAERSHQPAGSSQSYSRQPHNAGGVRRNLFQSQLTRRPTAPSTSSASHHSNTTNSSSGGGSANSNTVPDSLHLDADVRGDSSEIVVRDQHGNFELGDPPTPILDEPDELPLDEKQEHERERQKLAEAVKQHQIHHSAVHGQPEELLEAVRSSLRAKVAALAEDNWMFEREEPARG